jgi:dihydrofolate reductase
MGRCLQLLPEVDAFVLGGGMFPDYEEFWTAVLETPASVAEWIGRDPSEHELTYARTAAATPHLVVSTTLRETRWPSAKILDDLGQLREFKDEGGRPAYVVGGPRLVASLIDEGLLDELRLIVHPVAIGSGRSILGDLAGRHAFVGISAEAGPGGRLHLTCTSPSHAAVPSPIGDTRDEEAPLGADAG